MSPGLCGRSVLVLEPDPFMAGYVGAVLTAAGARLIGPAADVGGAFAAVPDAIAIDAALLGIGEVGADHWTLADHLVERAIPILFMSAHPIDVPSHLRHAPHLQRPFAAFQALEMVAALIEARLPSA